MLSGYNRKGRYIMKKIFVNTIVKTKGSSTQQEFVEHLGSLEQKIDGVELRNEYEAVQEMSIEDKSVYKKLKESNNWQYFLSIPGDLFTSEGLISEFEEIVQSASELGVESLKFNLGDVKGIPVVDADRFNSLVQNHQISITIENGQAESNGTIDVIQKALDSIEKKKLQVGFTFDLGNWIVMGLSSKKAFELFKDRISVFHTKNTNPNGDRVLLDQGDANWKEFLSLNIPYILEYPMTEEEFASEYAKFTNQFK